MSAAKRLSIVSDDFGLNAAVNEGIARGYADGLLTDTNLMPPCPAFDEAVAICRETGIRVGLHATFTCEGTGLRPWGPLTGAPSLKRGDGAFPVDPAETWASAAEDEALAEARAQYEKLRAAGITMTHIRQHRNLDAHGRCLRTLAALARETGVPYVQPHPALPGGTPYYRWDSFFSLSMVGTDLATRKARLRETLEAVGPGHHLWTVHCSSGLPSSGGADDYGPFAIWKTYCHLDQLLVTDDEVRRWLDELGIERVPMSRCPVAVAE